MKSCGFVRCSTLVPKANAWLQDNQYIYLVKCETLEKKVSTVDEVASDECMFIPKNHSAIYVKGLRRGSKQSIRVELRPVINIL